MNNLVKIIFLVSAFLFSSFVHAGTPANKTVVQALTWAKWSATNDGVDYNTVTLLRHGFKAADGADYVAAVTLECVIGSYDLDYGTALDGRFALVKVWLELDGVPLHAHNGEVYSRIGKVNFCGRGVAQFYASDDFEFELEANAGAYGFNFPILNVPHGEHILRVKAKLATGVLSIDNFLDEGIFVAVKSRTLVLTPVHVQVDETEGNDLPL